jgi:hypothetical protein
MMIDDEIKLCVELNFAFAVGSSEAVHGASRESAKEEDTKGEADAVTSEQMRQVLVQSAVSFQRHLEGVASYEGDSSWKIKGSLWTKSKKDFDVY